MLKRAGSRGFLPNTILGRYTVLGSGGVCKTLDNVSSGSNPERPTKSFKRSNIMEIEIIIRVSKEYFNEIKSNLDEEDNEYVKQIIREKIYDDAWDYISDAPMEIVE